MYTVSDVVEMGEANELILTEIKEASSVDDWADFTMIPEEYFDQ